MHSRGYLKLEKIKKPKLSELQLQKRKKFYENYEDATEEDWSRVMFTDESKICLKPFKTFLWMTKEE